MEEKIVFNTEDVNGNKVFGILAYIGILFLVPLFAAKDSQYARFHTNQGLVLFIAEVILNIAAKIVIGIFSVASLGLLAVPISIVLNLVVWAFSVGFMILGIVNACSGEAKVLPVIVKLRFYANFCTKGQSLNRQTGLCRFIVYKKKL